MKRLFSGSVINPFSIRSESGKLRLHETGDKRQRRKLRCSTVLDGDG